MFDLKGSVFSCFNFGTFGFRKDFRVVLELVYYCSYTIILLFTNAKCVCVLSLIAIYISRLCIVLRNNHFPQIAFQQSLFSFELRVLFLKLGHKSISLLILASSILL